MDIPKECTKSEFARMLGVDAANVSRWASANRLDLTARGRINVLPSLTKLLATLDPSRGGRDGMRGPGTGGSMDKIRALLEQAAKARGPEVVSELKAALAEVTAQLEAERKLRRECFVYDHDMAQMIFKEWEEIEREWDKLAAARAAGGDAFDRLADRIVGRVFYGRTDEQLDEDERVFYPD